MERTKLRVVSDGTQTGTYVETEDGKRIEGVDSVYFYVSIDDLGPTVALILNNYDIGLDLKTDLCNVPVYTMGKNKPRWVKEEVKEILMNPFCRCQCEACRNHTDETCKA